jgi:hypothetical protein
MPYCPALCAGAPPPQFTGGYGGALPPDATHTQVEQNYSIQPINPQIAPPASRTPAPPADPRTQVDPRTAAPRTTDPQTGSDTFAGVKDFLTGAALGGIPNWILLAGGLAAVLILPSVLRRGR